MARTDLDPDGTVLVQGELWRSTAADGPIERGERVEVSAVDGFRLMVRKVPGKKS
jgi:membrane-bound serine protease (ClpP class)